MNVSKTPNQKINGGSKTSILRQLVNDVLLKSKINNNTNNISDDMSTLKKSQKRRANKENQENEEAT